MINVSNTDLKDFRENTDRRFSGNLDDVVARLLDRNKEISTGHPLGCTCNYCREFKYENK